MQKNRSPLSYISEGVKLQAQEREKKYGKPAVTVLTSNEKQAGQQPTGYPEVVTKMSVEEMQENINILAIAVMDLTTKIQEKGDM